MQLAQTPHQRIGSATSILRSAPKSTPRVPRSTGGQQVPVSSGGNHHESFFIAVQRIWVNRNLAYVFSFLEINKFRVWVVCRILAIYLLVDLPKNVSWVCRLWKIRNAKSEFAFSAYGLQRWSWANSKIIPGAHIFYASIRFVYYLPWLGRYGALGHFLETYPANEMWDKICFYFLEDW